MTILENRSTDDKWDCAYRRNRYSRRAAVVLTPNGDKLTQSINLRL
jgi:hypothetical protein